MSHLPFIIGVLVMVVAVAGPALVLVWWSRRDIVVRQARNASDASDRRIREIVAIAEPMAREHADAMMELARQQGREERTEDAARREQQFAAVIDAIHGLTEALVRRVSEEDDRVPVAAGGDDDDYVVPSPRRSPRNRRS